MIELTVPEIGESITEVMIAGWLVEEGQFISRDQPLAELESDKATIELPAPDDGVLAKILLPVGATVHVGDVIARFEPGSAAAVPAPAPPASVATATATVATRVPDGAEPSITPSARRVLAEAGIDSAGISGSGKSGVITKSDATKAAGKVTATAATLTEAAPAPEAAHGEEQIIPLSPIRRTIARRLLESQQTTAQLTTFNEVDMSAVIELRKRYKTMFQERYGIKLGFMSFSVKAAIEALKAYPAVNAEIRDDNAVYKNYYNIGIAVGGGKGLVVPVIRDAGRLSFAETERAIADFGKRGSANRIELSELTGGTFTISNGGVYGSLMGTPVLNPPQSGILGLHAIKDRAVAVDGDVQVRPMMYLALTYDHRIVDGRDSVGFLIRFKEIIEDPARLLLEV